MIINKAISINYYVGYYNCSAGRPTLVGKTPAIMSTFAVHMDLETNFTHALQHY
jgi:hypothetical protein